MSSSGYTLAHPADLDAEASYTFTCGKIDAGIAVLIGSHAHLIEFPSLLLPPGCEPGSIVSITCARDHVAEKVQADSFWDLQTKIVNQFGIESPKPPNIRLRSVTQTSVTLEWDKLQLAQCKLICLSIWKNGQRLGALPNPINNTSTKLSGLDLGTEYTFHLVMQTSGGTFNSQKITVKTHSLNDTSGINVCFGIILPEELNQQAREALEQLHGRWSDKIQIDTTHFVCTMAYHPQHAQSKTSQPNNFSSMSYQRALQLSIPVVQPSWLLACLHERKMVPIAAHYLGVQPPPPSSSPSTANSSNGLGRPRSASKVAVSSSNSFSPKTTGIESSQSSNSEQVDQRHERTMSAPESAIILATSGRLSDQTERTEAPNLAVILESSKDTDPSSTHQALEEMDGLENVDLKSAGSHDDMIKLSLNAMNETDSNETSRLEPRSVQPSFIDQSNLPTPPTASNLSDILKENVDSPPENEGTGAKVPSISSHNQNDHSLPDRSETLIENDSQINEEASKTVADTSTTSGLNYSSNIKISTTAQASNSVNSSFNNSDGMIHDDGDDDPFSAASPTMSNPSPLNDEADFAHRLRLNNHQTGSGMFLVPDLSSPMSSSANLNEKHSFNDDNSSTTTIDNKQVDRPGDHDDKDDDPSLQSSLVPTKLTLNPTDSSPVTNENSSETFEDVLQDSSWDEAHHKNENNEDHREEVEDEGIGNSKVESGSGDTFFSTAESLDPSIANRKQNSKLVNLDPLSSSINHLDLNDDEKMDNVDI